MTLRAENERDREIARKTLEDVVAKLEEALALQREQSNCAQATHV
jgi:hypothetical protein